MISTCNGNTLTTHTGKTFDFANPHSDQIDIEDIAHALSNVCRWGGHCDFYSVAEHCVLASELVQGDDMYNWELQMAVLLHDATEAYIGDMPKPLKIMINQYNDIEGRIEEIITKKYGVGQDKRDIKHYDLMMFKLERRTLFPLNEIGPSLDEVPDALTQLEMWSPGEAKAYFLERWYELRTYLVAASEYTGENDG